MSGLIEKIFELVRSPVVRWVATKMKITRLPALLVMSLKQIKKVFEEHRSATRATLPMACSQRVDILNPICNMQV